MCVAIRPSTLLLPKVSIRVIHAFLPKPIQNRRYETRRLEANGGQFVPIKSLTIREFIVEYTGLFLKRRSRPTKGVKNFDIVFGELSGSDERETCWS